MSGDGDNVLYWGSGSPPCMRVMLALEEKGIKYTSKLISFSEKQHKGPDVLALNPRGQVPTLRLDGIVINESIAAIDFIEDQYKDGTSLMPSERKARALAMQRKIEALNLQQKISEKIVYPMYMGQEVKDMDERKEAAREELKMWDGYIEKTKAYVAGETFSLADCVLFPAIAFSVRMGVDLAAKYPNLDGYYKRMCDRASVKATWPPHWKDSPSQDKLKDL